MSALRALLAPAHSGALLLAGALTLFGTGCRDLDKAYDAYCETADCETGTPDGGEAPVVGLILDIPGGANVAVGGECINGLFTAPPEQPVTLRQLSAALAGGPGEGERTPRTVFGAPDCAGEAVTDLEVAAGSVAQAVSFRTFTDSPEVADQVIEMRVGEDQAWSITAAFQVEPGHFSFDPERVEGTPYDASAPVPTVVVEKCTPISGQLYGEFSGRNARHAPGKLSFLTAEAPYDGPGLSFEKPCLDEPYTVDDLSALDGPVVPAGDQLELFITASGAFVQCDLWMIGLDWVAEGLFQVTDADADPCP